MSNSQRCDGFVLPVLAALWLLLAAPLGAQVTGTISGMVEDASEAGISGATVTVISAETGAKRVVTTGETGGFKITALPIGAQQVEVEKAGFKKALRTGIDLSVGQDAVINVRLEVGELA